MINLGLTKNGRRLKKRARVRELAKKRYPNLTLTESNLGVLTDYMLDCIINDGFISDHVFQTMGVDIGIAERDEHLAEHPEDATVTDIERQGAEELARISMSYEDERPNFMDTGYDSPEPSSDYSSDNSSSDD